MNTAALLSKVVLDTVAMGPNPSAQSALESEIADGLATIVAGPRETIAIEVEAILQTAIDRVAADMGGTSQRAPRVVIAIDDDAGAVHETIERTVRLEPKDSRGTLVLASQLADRGLDLDLGETADVSVVAIANTDAFATLLINTEATLVGDAVAGEKTGSTSTAERSDPLIGRTLRDKYYLRKRIGKGGFGTVYLATDRQIGADVAVKIMNTGTASDSNAIDEFLAEARLLTKIDHENIVRWVTFDQTEDGLHYFVMEALQGGELSDVLRESGGNLPWERTAKIGLQVLSALDAVHDLGDEGSLLHLDLKEHNVFVVAARYEGEPDRIKVIDFGLSQHVSAEGRRESNASESDARESTDLESDDNQALYATMSISPKVQHPTVRRARGGTPIYCSPEHAKHLLQDPEIVELDGRADLYSLGVMLYHMVAGEYPYGRAKTVRGALRAPFRQKYKPLRDTGVPVDAKFAAFVDRCLAPERDDRYASAREAREALHRILNPKRNPLLIAVPLVLVIVALVIAIMMNTGQRNDLALHTDGGEKNQFVLGHGKNSTIELSVPQWSGSGAPEVTVVGMQELDAPPIHGFSATWGDDKKVTLSVDPRAGPDPDYAEQPGNVELPSAYLRFMVDGKALYSKQLDLAHLVAPLIDPGSIVWQGYPESASQRWDPRGRQVVVPIAAGVPNKGTLAIAGTSYPGSVRNGKLEFTLPTDITADGPTECDITVVDELDQESTVTVLRSLGGPLEIVAASFGRMDKTGFQPKDGRPTLSLGETYRLRVTTNRECEVVATFVDNENPTAPRFEPTTHTLAAGVPRDFTLAELGVKTIDKGFEGAVTVKIDDSRWVSRRSPGAWTRRLPFRLEKEPPRLDTWMALNKVRTKLGDEISLRWDDRLRFGVSRAGGNRAVQVRIVCASMEPNRLELSLNSADSEATSSVAVKLEEGRHRIQVTIADGGEVLEERTHWLRRDDTAPTVDLPPTFASDGAFVVTKESGAAPFMPTFSDESPIERVAYVVSTPTDVRAPVTLRLDGSDALDLSQVDGPDGPYSIEFSVRDAAGNESKETFVWERSVQSPNVTLVAPRRNGDKWIVPGGVWAIAIEVEDGSDRIVAATASVRPDDPLLNPIEITLVPGDDNSRSRADESPRWIAQSSVISPLWSLERVTIVVTVRDQGGNISRTPEISATLGDIAIPAGWDTPRRVDNPGEQMVFVPGNSAAVYTFGESDRRSFRVEIQKGAIRDFYIDAREVDELSFLKFVEAAAGYRARVTGGDARETYWQDRLRAAQADRAVTGVHWREADAYARWRGKRLPRLLDWEYALIQERPGVTGLADETQEWTVTSDRDRLTEEQPTRTATHFYATGSGKKGPEVTDRFQYGLEFPQATTLGFRCVVDRATMLRWIEDGIFSAP